MTEKEFITHACEQVLRFTRVEKWEDLSEAVKVQLGFNMGVMALGLNLDKEDSFVALSDARRENISMSTFREHLQAIISSHQIAVDEAKIARPF